MTKQPSPSRLRVPRRIWIPVLIVIVLGGLAFHEARTSLFQSLYFSGKASKLTYRLAPGETDSVCYPEHGPMDQRRGYARIPRDLELLREKGYRVTEQTRFSRELLSLCRGGLYPPYHEKPEAGLSVLDSRDDTLYTARYPTRAYPSFESIPPLVRDALLFTENRELLDPCCPRKNPAVEWDRLIKVTVESLVNRGGPRPGASTLATQIEKFRHSPGGITNTAGDKLRQMRSASYRAYLDGPDTRRARERIVLEYVNSVPLGSVAGHGEVVGLGEGLWAWFGTEIAQVNLALAGEEPDDPEALELRAHAFKKVLALYIAQKRPTLFLRNDRDRLARDTNRYLGLLAAAGVITPRLAAAARGLPLTWVTEAPVMVRPPFVDRKAADAARNRLLGLLNLDRLYVLDRTDLVAATELNGPVERDLIRVLRTVSEPAGVDALGLRGPRLLQEGDPSRVIYSVTLYEATPEANLLRIQVDNWDRPLNVNEGTKLDLGSSAKLRTLVNYLEIVAVLHDRARGKTASALRETASGSQDPLLKWVFEYLASAPDTTLAGTLDAAMNRTFSSSPDEAFLTGGGIHRFHNLSRTDDGRILTVREAFRHSVNLVFVRLMRDIVRHELAEIPDSQEIFKDPDHPRRRELLERFADREGKELTAQYFRKHRGQSTRAGIEQMAGQGGKRRNRLAALYRFVHPQAPADSLRAFLAGELPDAPPDSAETARLFGRYDPAALDLHDRGYVAGVHPLELWMVEYLDENPSADWAQVSAAGRQARQDAYKWLFRSKSRQKQDKRLRIELEIEAFQAIHRDWQRLGYPFQSLVPSYATSIGSSADRPAALADLMGILVNDGMRLPNRKLGRLRFAPGTPYETVLDPRVPAGERVLPAEVAAAARDALRDVVENGTARRVRQAFPRPDGTYLPVGGKTGTGDHRFETTDRHGLVVESRVVNRAATFVFFLGDRFFGVVTCYVPGPEAAGYSFTSALAVQLLATLAPDLEPLLEASPEGAAGR